MSNFINRVLIAVVGLPVVLGAVWAGGWWLFALVAIAGAVAVHEFVLMARPLAPLAPAAYIGVLLALLGAERGRVDGVEDLHDRHFLQPPQVDRKRGEKDVVCPRPPEMLPHDGLP